MSDESMHLSYSEMVALLNEQAARIRDLEALQADSAAAPQPVGEWMPIDGNIVIESNSKLYTVTPGVIGDWHLPDDIRLCKRVAAPQPPYGTSVAMPEQIAETIRNALMANRKKALDWTHWDEWHTRKVDAALAWLDELQRRPKEGE